MTAYNPAQQRGVALLTVLLVVALVSTIATHLTGILQVEVRRTGNTLNSDLALTYALGAEQFVANILKKDFDEGAPIQSRAQQYAPKFGPNAGQAPENTADGDQNIDTLAEMWAQEEGIVFPIEDGLGQLSGFIRDLNGCFNINGLLLEQKDPNYDTLEYKIDKDGKAYQQMYKLLDLLGYSARRDDLIAEVVDWLDSDDIEFGLGGKEDNYYLGLDNPYRTADTAMGSIEELRLLPSWSEIIDPDDEENTETYYDKLKPYFCLLPLVPRDQAVDQLINVNTIKVDQAELLAMLFKEENDLKFSVGDAKKLLEDKRGDNGFKSYKAFYEESGLPERKKTENNNQQAGDNNNQQTGDNNQNDQADGGNPNDPNNSGGENSDGGEKKEEDKPQRIQFFVDKDENGVESDPTKPELAVSLKSNYFLLEAEAVIGRGRAKIRSTLYRDPKSGKVKVLTRTIGGI